ncbi:WD40 repeat domain-containing protein [Kitasatospora paranensis]|uniref:WD40 repeat domain-containing protein n=1 Tax=Kitasatospora paranensis TaxID=258053 RepID=A0ABW2FUI0_9ACTN
MRDDAHRIPPLRAGRRPAGRALLGWLADERAPRLCRVAGSPGSGKSHLLRWLAEAGSDPAAPDGRRVRAVLDGERLTFDAALWLLGRQLGHLVRTPDDLLAALADDGGRTVVCVPDLGRAVHPSQLVGQLLRPMVELENVRMVVEAPDGGAAAAAFGDAVAGPAVLDLDLPQWTDRERYADWAAGLGADPSGYPSPGAATGPAERPGHASGRELIGRVPRHPDGTPDLPGAGPALLGALWTAAAREESVDSLLSDPHLLVYADPVAVTAALDGLEGALPRAWATAGPALVGEDDPGVRAAALRTRLLGMDADAVERLAAVPGPWQPVWAMWPDSSFGWPGPVSGLAVGAARYAGQLLLADPSGVIRTVDAASGRPLARVARDEPGPLRGMAVGSDGSVLLLDSRGGTSVVPDHEGAPAAAALGQALDALAEACQGELSVLTVYGPGIPAVADDSGTVCWLRADGVVVEKLHEGPVTALAGTSELLVSGGFDGTVRLWTAAGSGASAAPFDARPAAVGALAAADTVDGPVVAVGWADGLVRIRPASGGDVREVRFGSAVWALALTDGLLVAGTAEGVAAVRY